MEHIQEFVANNWQWFALALAILPHFAALTKTEWDNRAIEVIAKALHRIAGNYGKAKNASETPKAQ